MAMLRERGHTVTGRDWDRHSAEEMLADVPRLLRADQPDLVGISVLSVNRSPALALVRAI